MKASEVYEWQPIFETKDPARVEPFFADVIGGWFFCRAQRRDEYPRLTAKVYVSDGAYVDCGLTSLWLDGSPVALRKSHVDADRWAQVVVTDRHLFREAQDYIWTFLPEPENLLYRTEESDLTDFLNSHFKVLEYYDPKTGTKISYEERRARLLGERNG